MAEGVGERIEQQVRNGVFAARAAVEQDRAAHLARGCGRGDRLRRAGTERDFPHPAAQVAADGGDIAPRERLFLFGNIGAAEADGEGLLPRIAPAVVHLALDDPEKRLHAADAAVEHVFDEAAEAAEGAAAQNDDLVRGVHAHGDPVKPVWQDAEAGRFDPAAEATDARSDRPVVGDLRPLGGAQIMDEQIHVGSPFISGTRSSAILLRSGGS